jgi:hypothetical protein
LPNARRGLVKTAAVVDTAAYNRAGVVNVALVRVLLLASGVVIGVVVVIVTSLCSA